MRLLKTVLLKINRRSGFSTKEAIWPKVDLYIIWKNFNNFCLHSQGSKIDVISEFMVFLICFLSILKLAFLISIGCPLLLIYRSIICCEYLAYWWTHLLYSKSWYVSLRNLPSLSSSSTRNCVIFCNVYYQYDTSTYVYCCCHLRCHKQC